MADIIYRFNNSIFGGNHTFTCATDEMPDFFPVGQVTKENLFRGNGGKIWKYNWWRKDQSDLVFGQVSTHVLATMGSLVKENLSFLWYYDINDINSGTGTMVYVGGDFSYEQHAPNVVSFRFLVEELE